MLEINQDVFEEKTSKGLVLVDFSTAWCGPCQRLVPVLQQLQNIEVYKVDTEKNPELSANFNISSVPTLVFMRDGKVIERMIGFQPLGALQEKVNDLQS